MASESRGRREAEGDLSTEEAAEGCYVRKNHPVFAGCADRGRGCGPRKAGSLWKLEEARGGFSPRAPRMEDSSSRP